MTSRDRHLLEADIHLSLRHYASLVIPLAYIHQKTRKKTARVLGKCEIAV